MGFAEINEEIRASKARSGGEYIKLNRKEHGRVEGTLVDVKKRKKIFEEKPVLNKEGEQRYEWVLTIETPDGKKKVTCNESAQWAVRGALKEGQQLAEGGHIAIFVVEDPKKRTEQAEYKVIYSDPTGTPAETSSDGEESPF